MIVYVDRSDVCEGKLAEVHAAMSELAGFVDSNEPELIAYNVYFTEDGRQMSVVHVHRDSASLQFHMEVAAPAFQRLVGLVELRSIDVFGEVGEAVLGQLRQKAELLGSGSVAVHMLHAGFDRGRL